MQLKSLDYSKAIGGCVCFGFGSFTGPCYTLIASIDIGSFGLRRIGRWIFSLFSCGSFKRKKGRREIGLFAWLETNKVIHSVHCLGNRFLPLQKKIIRIRNWITMVEIMWGACGRLCKIIRGTSQLCFKYGFPQLWLEPNSRLHYYNM